MNTFEHNVLIRIEENLAALVKSTEHRLTENEVKIKVQEKEISECASKSCIKNIKIAIGFVYTVILAGFSAFIYKSFGM